MRTSEIVKSYVMSADCMINNIEQYDMNEVYDFINDTTEQMNSFEYDMSVLLDELLELELRQIESEMLTDNEYGRLNEIKACKKAIDELKDGYTTLYRKSIEVHLASKKIW